MRRRIGVGCILLGILCLLLSAGFVVYNYIEAQSAEESSKTMLQDVQKKIRQNIQEETAPDTTGSEALPAKAVALEIDGYACIGILSIPVLEIELPVLDQWSYEKLKKAPCQYFGSCYDSDFVIAAHNYPSHFGRLSELQPGDLVTFTDTEGAVYCYEVVLRETLPPTATEEMITSGFDLSLYTCTPGGGNRVTVRCKICD